MKKFFFFFFNFLPSICFWLQWTNCGILVPWLWMEPTPPYIGSVES